MRQVRSIPVFAFPGSGIEPFTSLWLELDHAVSWGRFDACWHREAAGRYRPTDAFVRAADDRVPPLASPPERMFEGRASFVCHERLPREEELGRPGLFLVRDPRGVFEALRLRHAPGMRMGDFLRAPLRRPIGRRGVSGSFPLSAGDVWASFHLSM